MATIFCYAQPSSETLPPAVDRNKHRGLGLAMWEYGSPWNSPSHDALFGFFFLQVFLLMYYVLWFLILCFNWIFVWSSLYIYVFHVLFLCLFLLFICLSVFNTWIWVGLAVWIIWEKLQKGKPWSEYLYEENYLSSPLSWKIFLFPPPQQGFIHPRIPSNSLWSPGSLWTPDPHSSSLKVLELQSMYHHAWLNLFCFVLHIEEYLSR